MWQATSSFELSFINIGDVWHSGCGKVLSSDGLLGINCLS